ncbi:hypothetical protein ABZW02_15935 [Streptomyces sp. NPDC005180]|uniref:hypothetical protein n=1 Tax=Streptomyces sp. NPDC005180 TaxID=3156868 RepID=UPI0033A7C5E1
MTAEARYALRGEDEDHEEEQLWALCEEAENLFADPPEPLRRRYELLGCAVEGELPAALGFLAVKPLGKDGEALWEWYLEDARVLTTRPCARDLSRLDVTIEAVRSDHQPDYPQRVPPSVGFSLSDIDDRLLGHFRDLAEVLPVEEPQPHAVRLLGCSLHGPLRDVVEGLGGRRLAYRHLDVLDAAGGLLTEAGHPHLVDWQPSPRGPGLYDLTVHMDRSRLSPPTSGRCGAGAARPSPTCGRGSAPPAGPCGWSRPCTTAGARTVRAAAPTTSTAATSPTTRASSVPSGRPSTAPAGTSAAASTGCRTPWAEGSDPTGRSPWSGTTTRRPATAWAYSR